MPVLHFFSMFGPCACFYGGIQCQDWSTLMDTARAMLTVRTQGKSSELRPIDITKI